MARIKSFTKVADTSVGKITDTDCLFSFGRDAHQSYVILRTTGSKGNAVTQTLHIDEGSAKELVKILQDHLKL